MQSNFFDYAVMKTSVIDREFEELFLCDPDHPGQISLEAVVFDGPEDYHQRIDDPELNIGIRSILIIRNCGPVGFPGGAEVVNMQPPARLIDKGIDTLPTLGDGRQSGTSASPSILNVSPEAAIGGKLALLKTGDVLRLDLQHRRIDVLLSEEEMLRRQESWRPPALKNQTPWEELHRMTVGQHDSGACMEPAVAYLDIIKLRGEARDSH